MSNPTSKLLYTGAEWDFDMLKRVDEACAEIAIGELGLDVYPNRFDVVGSDGMLDVYASLGVPKYYDHWSFGKHFITQEASYRKGSSGLALEMVINSVPCISYLMEENTATEQTTVIAHAAYGHNHFFKNNYLFKQWTDAEGVLDYFDYAKAYIARCEEQYGVREVERLLDAAHALMSHGVFRHSGKRHTDLRQEAQRRRDRALQAERDYNDLWAHTIPAAPAKSVQVLSAQRRKDILKLPEENILYFLEKYAPRLETWQREILRIVRNVAQYFYPQVQTKVMNEGCATYVHYRIMTRLHEKGQISDGNYQDFLSSHTNLILQPSFQDKRFKGFNPYALGFAMMRDIDRIVTEPTHEDRAWFPDIAGDGDVMGVLRDVWANYRDESCIRQFLSPRLMRDMRMFSLEDDPNRKAGILVEAIHDERGYRTVRRNLADMYDEGQTRSTVDIIDVDFEGDRRLILQHSILKGALLEEKGLLKVLQYLADLWTYPVLLREVDADGLSVKVHEKNPR